MVPPHPPSLVCPALHACLAPAHVSEQLLSIEACLPVGQHLTQQGWPLATGQRQEVEMGLFACEGIAESHCQHHLGAPAAAAHQQARLQCPAAGCQLRQAGRLLLQQWCFLGRHLQAC